MTSLRRRVALIGGRAAGMTVRRLGRGGGTALPGLVAGALAPDLLDFYAAGMPRGTVSVTGTNGKTTTAHLLSKILSEAGLEPLTNRSGSNLERGLLATLVSAAGSAGGIEASPQAIAVLEVDEAELRRLGSRLRPQVAVFLNLFRDQLDRYGEVDSVAAGWRTMLHDLPAESTLVLNADDPNVAQLAEGRLGRIVTFGVSDPAVALPGADHASDARFCANGTRFQYRSLYMGHVGDWRCDCCGRARPVPEVAALDVRLGPEGSRITIGLGNVRIDVTLPLPGLYVVYNALAAAAASHAIGVPPEVIGQALATAEAPFGRQEDFQIDGRTVRLSLAKNPTGLNEVLRTLAISGRALTVLAALNDGIQDGQDVSWIYDADIEQMAGRGLTLFCSGDRAPDLALRWELAGIEPAGVRADLEEGLELALSATATGGRVDVIATYTAMLGLRGALAQRASVASYWESREPGGRGG